MTIMPVWIKEQDDKGVWALLGSEPSRDSVDEFIPKERILNVVIPLKALSSTGGGSQCWY